MLTFVFLVSLTATTVLLLAIATEEVVRVTRAFFSQGNDEIVIGDTAASAVVAQEPGVRPSQESAQLRQFPQRARVHSRADQADRLPDDRAA